MAFSFDLMGEQADNRHAVKSAAGTIPGSGPEPAPDPALSESSQEMVSSSSIFAKVQVEYKSMPPGFSIAAADFKI